MRALACLGLLLAASFAHGQDLEPRSCVNTPVGMNFLVLGLGYLEGSTLYRGQKYERDVCGWGDPAAKLSLNVYGAPRCV